MYLLSVSISAAIHIHSEDLLKTGSAGKGTGRISIDRSTLYLRALLLSRHTRREYIPKSYEAGDIVPENCPVE